MYGTNDLYLSAYLKAKGHELIDIKNVKGRKTFIFNNEYSEMKQIVVDYYDGKGLVEPRLLVDHIKNMKSLTHNS